MKPRVCTTCFYSDIEISNKPCLTCSGFSKWVDSETFIEEKPIAGIKYDSGKPQWTLLPFKSVTQVVEVLTYGAKKYAPDNWKKVPNARQRYTDAAFRHITAYVGGEKNDSETGFSHLSHAICCLLYLLAFDLGEDK